MEELTPTQCIKYIEEVFDTYGASVALTHLTSSELSQVTDMMSGLVELIED